MESYGALPPSTPTAWTTFIQTRVYNGKSGLAPVCPVTSMANGYPFEVAVPSGHKVWILADHVKSVDWKARRAMKLGSCSIDVVNEVLARLAPLFGY